MEGPERILIQYFRNSKGTPINAFTGSAVKPDPNSTRYRYEEVQRTAEVINRLKTRAERNRAKARTAYVESFGGQDYLDAVDVGTYGPNAKNAGQRRNVGMSRDSLLRAVQSAYVVAQKHKLTPANRRILDRMYAENIQTAITAVPQQLGQQQWQ